MQTGKCHIAETACGRGRPYVDKWFRNDAAKVHGKFRHRVVTAHHPGNPAAIGFHALSLQLQDDRLLNGPQKQLFRSSNRVFASLSLDYLAVDRRVQGRGVGKYLLAHAIEHFYNAVVSFGMPVMTLFALDQETTEFYSKLGFRP